MNAVRKFFRTLSLFSAALLFGCSGLAGPDGTDIDPESRLKITGPAFGPKGAAFKPVSDVLEARCGTLDCHGSTYRPLRIYGKDGLRKPVAQKDAAAEGITNFDNYRTGGIETTLGELYANYLSVCGLEPEIMNAVVSTAGKPDAVPTDALTLIRKARLQEKHKGGKLWNENSEGDNCLRFWITGSSYESLCKTEAARD